MKVYKENIQRFNQFYNSDYYRLLQTTSPTSIEVIFTTLSQDLDARDIELYKVLSQRYDFAPLEKVLVLSGTEGQKQIDEPWYRLLKNTSKIRGEKAIMGRNNVIFTLALANYASGVAYSDCMEELSDYNAELEVSLKKNELKKTIASAYSGRYEAANRDFIKILCQTWISSDLTTKDLFIRQGWYKFKKSRDQRQRSHFSEWREDFWNYIKQKTNSDSPYLRVKKKEITAAIGIPERSLDYVLKTLQSEGKIYVVQEMFLFRKSIQL